VPECQSARVPACLGCQGTGAKGTERTLHRAPPRRTRPDGPHEELGTLNEGRRFRYFAASDDWAAGVYCSLMYCFNIRRAENRGRFDRIASRTTWTQRCGTLSASRS
jgi:hypothetical protein